MGRRGRFGQREPRIAPGNQVSSAGDGDLGFVISAPDHLRLADLEKLRMERPAVKLEHEFRNSRSNGEHNGSSLLIPF